MWDLWLIKLSNLVTIGNISTVAGILLALVYFYYRIRRFVALQQAEFLKYVNSLTQSQTLQIKEVVHKELNTNGNDAPVSNGQAQTDVK